MRGGFTLLEVLIALVIAGIALTALVQAAGQGIGGEQAAAHYSEAVSRARSHLDAARRGGSLRAGDNQGNDGGGFHWRLRVVEEGHTMLRRPGAALSFPLALYGITVWISWQEGGRQRAVRLQSTEIGTP